MNIVMRLRSLFRPRGGTMPDPPPLGPDEERVILSPGWNWPPMETSSNYQGPGLNAYLRKPRRVPEEEE